MASIIDITVSFILFFSSMTTIVGSSADPRPPRVTIVTAPGQIDLQCTSMCSERIIWNRGNTSEDHISRLYDTHDFSMDDISMKLDKVNCSSDDSTGIRIYTIGFNLNRLTLNTLMTTLPNVSCFLTPSRLYSQPVDLVNLFRLVEENSSLSDDLPIITSRKNNTTLNLNCSLSCLYTRAVWSRPINSTHRFFDITRIEDNFQENNVIELRIYNDNCIMSSTSPQVYELILDLTLNNTATLLPNVTCVGIIGPDEMHIFSSIFQLSTVPTLSPRGTENSTDIPNETTTTDSSASSIYRVTLNFLFIVFLGLFTTKYI